MGVAPWRNMLSQLMPQGLAWPQSMGSIPQKKIAGLAPRLQRCEESATQLLLEMRPESTVKLLPEWETYLGLPDCVVGDQSFQSRRMSVIEKKSRKGGLQAWNIEKQAADLGFKIKVDECFPHHCLRDCTYPLHQSRNRHVLKIRVFGIPQTHMTCLDTVSKPLVNGSAQVLECVLNKNRMAGKYYEFIYE